VKLTKLWRYYNMQKLNYSDLPPLYKKLYNLKLLPLIGLFYISISWFYLPIYILYREREDIKEYFNQTLGCFKKLK